MKFTVEIFCDNDAFVPAPDLEVGSLLRRLADQVEGETDRCFNILDINGKSVGLARWQEVGVPDTIPCPGCGTGRILRGETSADCAFCRSEIAAERNER